MKLARGLQSGTICQGKNKLKTDSLSQHFTHVSIYALCVGYIYFFFSFFSAHSTANKFNLFGSKMCEKKKRLFTNEETLSE